MGFRVFNTLSRSLEPFVPLDSAGKKVGIYCCGPTVHDFAHIGNFRTFVFADIVRRHLTFHGFDVRHVMNITDVEDKIIRRVNESGKSLAEFTGEFEQAFFADLEALSCQMPHDRPHATAFIGPIIKLIKKLESTGIAYKANDGSVYFSIEKYREAGNKYGQLLNINLDEMRPGERVSSDEYEKESIADFALWKAAKPGEPTWASPWGAGRPGWHIECVAMSLGILGDGFDLHGGGSDLVFPHHTNERAEAIAAGREFATHWMHNAMLNIGGEKMSKSLGNFTTIQALLDEHPLNARALRLLLLQTHYRKTMELNADVIAQGRAAIERLDAMARKAGAAGVTLDDDARDQQAVDEFIAAMDDDLATPEAMAVVFALARRANAALDAGDAGASALVATTVDLAGALGVVVGAGAPTSHDNASDHDAEIDAYVEARTKARANKDFAEADRIRHELIGRGIVVEDTANGSVWHRS